MRLRYTPAAFVELSDILDYITNARRPARVMSKLVYERLSRFWNSFRMRPSHKRARLAPHHDDALPIVIFYEMTDAEIVIVGVPPCGARTRFEPTLGKYEQFRP